MRQDWLNPTLALDAAQALLVPYPADRLMAYEVSSKVNAATSNSPDLLQPSSAGVTTPRLLRVHVECAPDRLARRSSGFVLQAWWHSWASKRWDL